MTVDYDGRPVADKRLFDAQARIAKLEAALREIAVGSYMGASFIARGALKEDGP